MLAPDKAFTEFHEAPRGGKFSLRRDATGLYFIKMENGGVPPKICDEKYTSLGLARKTLKKYFDSKPEPIPRETKSKKTSATPKE